MHRTAQFLWIGESLSLLEQLALTSFRDHDWDVVLYTYDSIQHIPTGIRVLDADEIVSRSQIFPNKFGDSTGVTFSTFADLFRLELLARKGGWWFDADMVAIKGPQQYERLTDLYVGSTWEIHWKQCAINCAMFAPPGHPLIQIMRDRAFEIVLKPDLKFAETGPFLLQETLKEHADPGHIAPFWEFCPYPWRQIRTTCFRSHQDLVINTARLAKHIARESIDQNFKAGRLRTGTTAVHLHNEIWRRSGISKDGPFHPYSFIGRSLRRHGIEA